MNAMSEKIAELHANPAKIVLVCTGAAAGCQNLVSQVPGSSATLLDCMFPYSNEALVDFLGFVPEKFASEKTAMFMAARAWRRAVEILARKGEGISSAMGVGVTGALATNRLLRGEHRVCISARTANALYSARVVFEKNAEGVSAMGRIREGELSDLLTLNMALHAAGIGQVPVPSRHLTGDLAIISDEATLLPRQIAPKPALRPDSHTLIGVDGGVLSVEGLDPERTILFDGSFDPLHFGHERAAKEAEKHTGKRVVFAITDHHPVKGKLSDEEALSRAGQFHLISPVLVTRGLRLFLDKAKAFPGFAFLMGVDTLKRMLDPSYSPVPIHEILQTFADCGTTFIVASRPNGGEVIRLDDLKSEIPSRFHAMFSNLPLRADVSSTSLRGPAA